MTTAEALTAAKNRLNITNTDFDVQLTDFFDSAIDRLNPKVLKEVAVQTVSATVDDYGEATVDLSGLATPLDDVRLVEAREGGAWYPTDTIHRHATSLRVRGLNSSVTQFRLYGLKAYAVVSAAADIPERYEQPVVWFMMSEFYDMLAGSKSKFNVYIQNNAGNAIEDMRSEADYYESKADRYLDEKATLYGSQ